MQRSQYEEKLQHVRALTKRCDQLDDQARIKHYIDLEKPQFAGWDYWVTLSESRLRSSDAEILMEVVTKLNLYKRAFTRKVGILKTLRKYKYDFRSVRSHYNKSGFAWHPSYGEFNLDITERVYATLSHDAKNFFRKVEETTWWGMPKIYYTLDEHKFPMYELTYKVEKAYWTKLLVLDGDAIGDYEKIRRRLWWGDLQEYYINTHRGGWRRGRYRDDFYRGIKSSWSKLSKELVKEANTQLKAVNGWQKLEEHPEHLIDVTPIPYEAEEALYKRTKAFIRRFGWD